MILHRQIFQPAQVTGFARQADHLVAPFYQLLRHPTPDKTGRSGHKISHFQNPVLVNIDINSAKYIVHPSAVVLGAIRGRLPRRKYAAHNDDTCSRRNITRRFRVPAKSGKFYSTKRNAALNPSISILNRPFSSGHFRPLRRSFSKVALSSSTANSAVAASSAIFMI